VRANKAAVKDTDFSWFYCINTLSNKKAKSFSRLALMSWNVDEINENLYAGEKENSKAFFALCFNLV